ncbi:iron ABC transporter ATP-binding protein [Thermococcus sp. P6]|uniref:ABC transporter substrate-binding protein n=1 Tax=Thermococcus sp. P6 TaxID=122420 RepID=UPI000B5A1DE0|nr:ABC transporter substrate-binding protein [Thermococcus sp. P6]ASJ10784.1 iron ABC transporter ATP-binding protein [Thermococcus sp. P6]
MKRTALLLVLLLLGAVVAAGCIGGEKATTETSTSSPATTSNSPTESSGTTTSTSSTGSSGTTTSTSPTESSSITSTTSAELETGYPIEIRDFANRTVTIEKKPERIVSLAPSITEDLYYIGQLGSVVGVTKWADFPPAVANITRVGGYGKYANLEIIASLNPDLILADGYSMSILEDLEKIAPVVIIDPKNITDIYRSIELLGKITNSEEEARRVVADMKAEVDYVTSMVAGEPKPKVLFITWWNPIWVPGNGTFQDDLIRLAGGENVFHDVNGWAQVSMEQVLERDPEVIILSSGGITAEELCNTPLVDTKALKEGRVFTISDENLVSRPGPRIVYGLREIATYLHPEAFNYTFQPLTCNATASAGG